MKTARFQAFAANLKRISRRRGIAAADLAARIAEVDGASELTANVIANVTSGRRGFVTVDELSLVADALGITDPWSLTRESAAACYRCGDNPPPGFTCNSCGVAR